MHFNKMISTYFNVFQRIISTYFQPIFGFKYVEICKKYFKVILTPGFTDVRVHPSPAGSEQRACMGMATVTHCNLAPS